MASRAVIYTRISKDEAGEGLGVARQERACRELAKKLGLSVIDVLTDNDRSAMSGRKRPAFEALLSMIEAGDVDSVIVYHTDRLYRRAVELERIVPLVGRSGVQVHTVAAGEIDLSTASGQMIARMLGAAAQHESQRLGERGKLKGDELAAAGAAPGGRPPYGYRRRDVDPSTGKRTGPYIIDVDEAVALRLIASRVLDGSSLLSVARELDAKGITTREGRPWHHSTVRAVVVNPAVAGLRVLRREIAGMGTWSAIFDRSEWEQIRAVVADPARKRKRPARKYMLTGLALSPAGDVMVGYPGTGGRRMYGSRGEGVEQWVSIGADSLEVFVTEQVLDALDEERVLVESRGAPVPELARLEGELAELTGLRARGVLSLETWLAASASVTARHAEASSAVASIARRPSHIERLLAKPKAARRAWETLSIDERRETIAGVVESVVVGPAERGRWSTVEERLDYSRGWGIRWRV